MSIDRVNISNNAIDRALQSHGTDEARPAEQPQRSSTATDAISLSAAAKDADRLANLVEQSRSDRLNEVREALANGTYSVSGEDIAKKLMELNTR
jgi:flagellar biosynthesis anti-sigma factor FlgM